MQNVYTSLTHWMVEEIPGGYLVVNISTREGYEFKTLDMAKAFRRIQEELWYKYENTATVSFISTTCSLANHTSLRDTTLTLPGPSNKPIVTMYYDSGEMSINFIALFDALTIKRRRQLMKLLKTFWYGTKNN